MRFQTPRRPQPAFNLTPLIDILFIVLIFLVLTTTFKEVTTFQVDLPLAEAGEREAQEFPGLIEIAVAADGSVEYEGELLSVAELSQRLATVSEPNQVSVRLRADARVTHGVIVRVMDVVQRNGIYRLSIETRVVDASGR